MSQAVEKVERISDRQPTHETQCDLQQPVETSSKPANFVLDKSSNEDKNQHIMSGSPKLDTEPLTGMALAQRLNVSDTTISRRRSRPDFPQWSCHKDPDGIAWMYLKKTKHFVASVSIPQAVYSNSI